MTLRVTLSKILFAGTALALAIPALATGNCANGQVLYSTPVSGLSCSSNSCHKADPSTNTNKIRNGANNPTRIATAINSSIPEMAIFRGKFTASDLDDLATWIAAAPTCPVAGTAVIGVAPASYAFPTAQNVGSTSAATTLTVSNTGTGAASGVSIANSNAAEFPTTTTCAATLANGASCTISASFSPAAAGSRSATLTVNNSAGAKSVTLSGTGSVVAPGALSVPAAYAFAAQAVGTGSAPNAFTLTNTGGSAVTIAAITSSNAAEFAISSSSCAGSVAASASCSFSVTFTASAAGTRSASITIASTGMGSPQMLALSGTGTSVVTPGALTVPAAYVFADQTVGAAGTARTFTLSNAGGTVVTISSVSSSNPTEFAASASTCSGSISPGATCSFVVTFAPSAAGARSAAITLVSDGVGSPQAILVSGNGTTTSPPAPSATVDLLEYYHAGFDHYFMTTSAFELAALDVGTVTGWVRTGYQFKAYPLATPGTATVCRFFSAAFAPKSSHFYTDLPYECDLAKTYPAWTFEGEVFNIPAATPDGNCDSGTVPVYRLYNNGQGGAPNHRYVALPALRDQMSANGWILEGNGPGMAFMCSPQ